MQTNLENGKFLEENNQYIKKFLNPNELIISEKIEKIDNSVSIILAEIQVFIPLGSLVNIIEEIEKLNDKLNSLKNEIQRCEKMLSNENFLRKAPKEKVEEEQTKLNKYIENYKEVENRIRELKDKNV